MKVVFVCLLSAMLELWLFNTRSLREVASFSFIICFSERPSSPRDEEAQVAHTHTHPRARSLAASLRMSVLVSPRRAATCFSEQLEEGWKVEVFIMPCDSRWGWALWGVCVCDFAACWEKTQMFSGFVVGVKAGTHPGRRSGRSSERLPVHHRADLFN